MQLENSIIPPYPFLFQKLGPKGDFSIEIELYNQYSSQLGESQGATISLHGKHV